MKNDVKTASAVTVIINLDHMEFCAKQGKHIALRVLKDGSYKILLECAIGKIIHLRHSVLSFMMRVNSN